MKEKKEVYKVKPLTEGKKNIIATLIEEYNIKTAEDIQEALKDLLGGTIKSMMEAEMDEHIGYEKYQHSDGTNYRNSVKKRQKDISEIDQKIINMYAHGLTTRQISEQIEDIYGFECSESFISNVTDKILQDIQDWQNRPLEKVYSVIFIDATHFSVREDNRIKKIATYVVLGITKDGMKEVLSLEIGENESSKYWLGVLNALKNRGMSDIMVICADGLTGIKEAIATAFLQTEYQCCIVHQVRNTLKYVSYKDKKEFASDLKSVYLAATESQALDNLDKVNEKWEEKYPNSMSSWYQNWDILTPIFKFSLEVRKVIYTTNAIESLNSTYKKLNRQRTVYPSDKALLKALYLSTMEATKKWTQPLRNWGKVYGEFSIMYEGRFEA